MPQRASRRAWAGLAAAQGGGRRRRLREVSAWLPPGRYQVTGRSPDISTVTASGRDEVQTCSRPVIVGARHAGTIAVVCIVP